LELKESKLKDGLLIVLGFLLSASFQMWLDKVNRKADHEIWEKQTNRTELVSAMKNIMVIQAEIRNILQLKNDKTPLSNEVYILTERIDAEAQFIPDADTRDLMEELSKIIWWSDKIAVKQGFLKRNQQTEASLIAWVACNQIPVLAGKIVRGEKYDPHPKYIMWRDTRQSLDNLDRA
jgi:hypothetical protein